MQLRLRLPTGKQRLAFFVCVAAVVAVAGAAFLLFRNARFNIVGTDGSESYRLDIKDYNDIAFDDSSSEDQRLSSVCAVATCGEKFLAKFTQQHQQEPQKIPPIRHMLWKGEYVFNTFIPQLKTWQKIHPNWTFVLWRYADLEPFVRKHFPGKIHRNFVSLPAIGLLDNVKIGMFSCMLMYQFGGVYADLNYTLVSSLDSYRRYPAVVTREPEAHAAKHYGLTQWPLPILTNPEFFMSAPGHPFFNYVLNQLVEKEDTFMMEFHRSFYLSRMLSAYYQMHLVMVHPTEFVYIPPSYSFYPYAENRLSPEGGYELEEKIAQLNEVCHEASSSEVAQVQQFCKDVVNLDPITDKNHPVVAHPDMQKKQPVHEKHAFDSQDLRLHLNDLKLGDGFM